MSEEEEKYHREWASTVASKALLSLAGDEEAGEGEGREERKSRGGCRIQSIRLPSGPCEI